MLRAGRRRRMQQEPGGAFAGRDAEVGGAPALQGGSVVEGTPLAEGEGGGASVAHFVPTRVVIAGNRRCVNRCAAAHGCRAFTAAAPERRDQCVLSCHRECSVCPLSAVTRDCGRACVSQCESAGAQQSLGRGVPPRAERPCRPRACSGLIGQIPIFLWRCRERRCQRSGLERSSRQGQQCQCYGRRPDLNRRRGH